MLKQARSAALKARKARRQEIADELQRSLEDRRAARSLLDELAGYEHDRRRTAAVLRGKVKPEQPTQQASTITKRRAVIRASLVSTSRSASSWVVDDLGLRGVHYHQSYLSRKSPGFYRGAATDRWLYDVRDEAVVRDAEGNVVWFSNLGGDIDEIAAAWQAVEDATTRKNGKVQIRIIVPLDADASPDEQAAALRHFCERVLKPLDLPHLAVMHSAPEGGDQRNAHGHILTNLRPIERITRYTWAFADEVRGELDGKNGVQMLRHFWAWSMTEAAEGAGRPMQYTGLSYAARGLPLEAGEHLGENRAEMVARGERVWAHERNRIKSAHNGQRMILRDLDRKMAALIQLRDTLIDERQRVDTPQKVLVTAPPIARVVTPLGTAPSPAASPSPLMPATPSELAEVLASSATTLFTQMRLTPATDPQPRPDTLQSSRRMPADAVEAMRSAVSPGISPQRAPANRLKRDGAAEPLVSASSGQAELQSAAIIETMQELLRLIGLRRAARRRDPAAIAWRRRLKLVKTDFADVAFKPVPERTWLDLNPHTISTPANRTRAREADRRRLERIATGGGYVSPRRDGALVQEVRTPGEPAPERDWWSQRHIQQPLIDLRDRQRQLMTVALRTSRITPDRWREDKPPAWSIDVRAVDRERLGRWAESPAFHRDLVGLSRSLLGQADRSSARPPLHAVAPVTPSVDVPDGFGGQRDTLPPTHIDTRSPVRLKAFVANQPTDHLLRLLNLAARHPRAIVFASDGRLTVEGEAPAMLASLLHGWRHDAAVERLVVETVRLSREAGAPTWPKEVAIAVRRFEAQEAAPATRPVPVDHDRDQQR